ncbi:MAG: PA2928 family protein [Aquabacterium sp.]
MSPTRPNESTAPQTPHRRNGARLWALGLAILLLAVIGVALWLGLRYDEFTERRRAGPVALVSHAGGQQLWVLVTFQERTNVGRRGWGERLHTRYHIELQGHDPATGHKRWSRRLLSLGERDGGHGAQARILGPEGDKVWLFVGDQPVLLNAADGSVRSTRLDILARNPALRDLLPTELDHYTFDQGLVVVAADGQRLRIQAEDLSSATYPVADEQAFQRRKFMTTRWNGGYATRDFLTPQARPGGRWYGLFTPEEAREAGQDGFGSNLKEPDRTWRPEAALRRSFHTARIGRTKAFSEGSHPRLMDVTPLPQSPSWLQAGLMVQAGQRTPLLVDGTDLLVLHRTRIDRDGRAAMARVRIDADHQVRTLWAATLPFTELTNRWQLPTQLVMLGGSAFVENGVSYHEEHLAVVDLASGTVRGWNLTDDRAWAGAATSPAGAASR